MAEWKRVKSEVAIIKASTTIEDIITEQYINDRLMAIKMKDINDGNTTIVVANGANKDARKDEKL